MTVLAFFKISTLQHLHRRTARTRQRTAGTSKPLLSVLLRWCVLRRVAGGRLVCSAIRLARGLARVLVQSVRTDVRAYPDGE